jgi:hypothetical protein
MGLGCDESPAPPPQLAQPAPATAPARPTTQELLTGPYKKIPLPNMPLTLTVPQSWNIEVGKDFPATFVTGPSPSSTIFIQLSQPDANTFKQEQLETILNRARKELEQHPDPRSRVEMLTVGPMKVLESLVFQAPKTIQVVDARGLGLLDEKGNLVTETVTPVEWSLTAFVPTGDSFKRHQLKVFDLTAKQYDEDRALLEKVLRSINLDGSAPAPAQ